MKYSWWPHTTNTSVASYRLRCDQIIKELKFRGVDAELYDNSAPPNTLILSKRYDRESIAHASELRSKYGTRLILDICDNHFYATIDELVWNERSNNLRKAINCVDAVITSSEALAEIVRTEASPDCGIHVIEDAAEPPFVPSLLLKTLNAVAEYKYRMFLKHIERTSPCQGRSLVWFGNHGSAYADGGMRDLGLVKDRLHELNKEKAISLTIISNSRKKFDEVFNTWSIPLNYIEWNKYTFSRALSKHDIAIIPISQNPFTICKTNNRVATALIHGLGVVADSIPSYRALNECIILDDWNKGFENIMNNSKYRETLVENGCKRIKIEWSLRKISDKWEQLLNQISGS